jgi:phage terminase large subunit GpA-like protein
MTSAHYSRALDDAFSGFRALMPPNRMTVVEGASKNLVIKQTGGAGDNWKADKTPYMVEPMNAVTDRSIESIDFVGPARTGKTAGLLLGTLAHVIVNDPGDALFIQMSKEKAREFSKTDVQRALRNSPNLAAMRTGRRDDSNTHDEMFKHGMWLRIAWPTVGNVSGSTYRYVFITDIDRMENAENVDGEGPLFDLAKKRTTTFMSRGRTIVESSPGYELTDPYWRSATPHEAPPTGGILNLYNRSDRRRWYWGCPDCHCRFEARPGLGLFNLPSDLTLAEEVRSMNIPAFAEHHAKIICPGCGSIIEPRWKKMLNASGIWVPDGVILDDRGTFDGPPQFVGGEAMRSSARGYWLGGVAAAYQKWESLIENHLLGLRDYVLTGSEEKLKQTTNTDQGSPYMPRVLAEAAAAHAGLQEKVQTDVQRYVVPDWTRCVVAAVDVQGGVNSRFVVQVHAVGPHMEQQLVNRYEIKFSRRPGMGTEFAPIDPAKYPEDWDVLTGEMLHATWKTPDADREIRAKLVVVDTGGEDGVTANAYDWYRRVRKAGMGVRVMLYKGANTPNPPLIKESKVGGRGSAPGDIPLYVCNPNLLSDMVDNGLRRPTPGPGFIHFPQVRHATLNPDGWLPQSFFDELEAEVRLENGTWSQRKKRNESFDLCRMIRAGLLRLGLDKVMDWNAVPAWLAPLAQNSEIVLRVDRQAAQANTPIAPAEPPEVRVIRRAAPKQRRVSRAAL